MPLDSPRRLTSTEIRKATLLPKPMGGLAKAYAYENGTLGRPPRLTVGELNLLRHIAEHADMLDAPVPDSGRAWLPHERAAAWILVPVPQWVIDGLAQFGADQADLEPDEDREANGDLEPSEDLEPDDDGELGHVRPESVDRHGLADDAPSSASPAQRARVRDRGRWGMQDELRKVRRAMGLLTHRTAS